MTYPFVRQALPIDTESRDWAHFADLERAHTGGVRIYAIGDVHGHLDQLVAMQAAIAADRARHPVPQVLIVYLGDFIDRGPRSAEVIDQLIEQRSSTDKSTQVVCLTGNHDAWLNQFLQDTSVLSLWARKGGLETLLSYDFSVQEIAQAMANTAASEELRLQLLARMPQRHKDFMASLALSHQQGGYFFAHAGVEPDRSLSEQRQEDLTWIRDRFLVSKKNFGKVVVHGHTAGARVESLPNRINVDTGIYATQVLSCVVLEGAERHVIAVDGRILRAWRSRTQEAWHG